MHGLRRKKYYLRDPGRPEREFLPPLPTPPHEPPRAPNSLVIPALNARPSRPRQGSPRMVRLARHLCSPSLTRRTWPTLVAACRAVARLVSERVLHYRIIYPDDTPPPCATSTDTGNDLNDSTFDNCMRPSLGGISSVSARRFNSTDLTDLSTSTPQGAPGHPGPRALVPPLSPLRQLQRT